MAREPAAHPKPEPAAKASEHDSQPPAQGAKRAGKGETKAAVTAGGVRIADDRFRFEKHALKPGKGQAPKQPFARPWGSQPMSVDVKTGALKGAPHPEPKPDEAQAYGR